jgi:hypothetical protein
MRALTLVPALLMLLMSVALGFLAAMFGYAALTAINQHCAGCPIDRSQQFGSIFSVYFVMFVIVAAVHVLVARGIWRRRGWATVLGLVISAIGVVVTVMGGPPAYQVALLAAAAAYAIVFVSLVIRRFQTT